MIVLRIILGFGLGGSIGFLLGPWLAVRFWEFVQRRSGADEPFLFLLSEIFAVTLLCALIGVVAGRLGGVRRGAIAGAILSVALAAGCIALISVRFHAAPDLYIWVWIASALVCSITTGITCGLLGRLLRSRPTSGIRGPEGPV